MEGIKIYRTSQFLALVVILMGFALLFTVDTDRLIVFYKNFWSTCIVIFLVVVSPLLILFGFSFKIIPGEVVNTNYFFFTKRFKISDLSHVLYQPTWRGVMSMNSRSNMRSLHIVRRSGGWADTISLANGPFREEDLADIARRLKKINPQIELDDYTQKLIKKI